MPAIITDVETSKKAAIYVRISRDSEGQHLGVQRQEQDCRALAKRLRLTVADIYSDNDISASSRGRKARPGYKRMLADIESGRIGAVLAYSTSRITRRPLELEHLIPLAERGLRIHTVAAAELDLTTANGRAMARTLAAFDAREAEENSERARRERQQRREAGRWVGGARPFGFENDGTTPRPAEQAFIRSACAAVLAGRSLASIARDWDGAVPTVQRAPHWRASSVRDVIRNPRVIGQLPDGTRAQWAPVVDESTWRGVQAVLSDPTRRKPRGETRLLTGIAVCGLCGATLHGSVSSASQPNYRCSAVRHLDRTAGPLDDYVTRVVLAYLARERVTVMAGPDTAGLAVEAESLRTRQNEAADLFAAGRITSAQLDRISSALQTSLDDAEQRMANALGNTVLSDLPADAAALEATWQEADIERRRAIVLAVPLTITVHPPGRGVRTFNPDTVQITGRQN